MVIKYGEIVQSQDVTEISGGVLPCPMCKSRDITVESNGRLTNVRCSNCGFQSPPWDGHESAISAWNGLTTN